MDRVSLPCAQQEMLSCSYTVTLHGLSIPDEIEFVLLVSAARAQHTKKVARIE
jgi:hypothetical protein